jgi:hypothetical protein
MSLPHKLGFISSPPNFSPQIFLRDVGKRSGVGGTGWEKLFKNSVFYGVIFVKDGESCANDSCYKQSY